MPNWETIVVGVIVGAALLWAARSVWRATRQKRICSDCASSGGCPIMEGDAESATGSTCEVTELGPRIGSPE